MDELPPLSKVSVIFLSSSPFSNTIVPMAKTHRRRAARAAKEAAAASARAAACSSRRAAVSLLSPHDWTQLGTALDGLLWVEFPSSFTDLDLLCPMEAWLVVDLAYVGINGNAVSSLRSGLVRAVDALARLCLLAETLRAWDDLWLSFWARVLTSDMYQDRYSGERDRQISQFIKCTKAKGLHVALRWHGRRLGHHVIDPLRRFLEAATDVQQQENDAALRHAPVQIALRFEQCQLTSADLQSLHSLVKVSPSGDFTPPRLCNQTELQQLSLRGNALYDNHLEALTALLEDPSVRRINGLVLGDTFPSDVDIHDTYATTFQRALTAALQPKPSMVPSLDSNNAYDPGVRVSLDECKGVHTRLVEAIENALVQATRPIRGVSFASLELSDFGAILRFTRLLMTPLPTATLDCELNLSYVNIDREQDEVEEALFVSLAEMVIEAIPRFLNVLTGVTCRLLHAEIYEDPFLQVVDTAASEHVTTTAWYDVVSVTHNGFFQLSLPTKAGGVSTAATGWVSSTAIASLRRGDAVLVGANYSQLILDGTKHSHLGPPNSGRLIMGLVASLGANLTRLSLRNNAKIFNELPSYLSRCPELLELNACDGGCSHWENGSYYRRNWLEASEDLGANLQALSVADCSIDAASLLLLPPLSSLRYLQLANNPLKGEGLDQLLTRLNASRSIQYVDVRSNETLDSTDAQYVASVKSTIERALKDEYVSVDARMAFLSVLPRLEDEYDLPQCIPHDAVAAIFEMAGTRASRTVVW
jgi:hypothetical protein